MQPGWPAARVLPLTQAPQAASIDPGGGSAQPPRNGPTHDDDSSEDDDDGSESESRAGDRSPQRANGGAARVRSAAKRDMVAPGAVAASEPDKVSWTLHA